MTNLWWGRGKGVGGFFNMGIGFGGYSGWGEFYFVGLGWSCGLMVEG